MTDMNRLMYALCATGFLLMAAYGLLTYGDKFTRVMVLTALLLAGLSQFVAQNESPRAQGAAWALIIFGMIMFLFSLIGYVMQVTL